LVNIFLHYVFDLWVRDWRRQATGDVIVVRYADDWRAATRRREVSDRTDVLAA
jgi:RNA-directed DNA polymerase